jgi:hypothetical protein
VGFFYLDSNHQKLYHAIAFTLLQPLPASLQGGVSSVARRGGSLFRVINDYSNQGKSEMMTVEEFKNLAKPGYIVPVYRKIILSY